ncbi:HAD family hydrolase [Levilactobacillus acidifarinae]|uniref:Phosphatase n=1 Tax=Levilactobacillus acidifarinae DSM 19394 = JCM 15949 TaxID=1423715 RepID=A0A0R1LV38_9LACO|nr:HAD-IA family hydrolase [Levilactobacillus acidifarinae]KRK96146.1 phosphatase [Levilactobacillus acidifarinae DSM 19394]GEO69507.1 phosphatase [Levilactobacillus acidifarinae]
MQNFFFDFDSTLADTKRVAVVATQQAFLTKGLTAPAANVVVSYMGVPIEVSFAKMADRPLTPADLEPLFQEFRRQYALADGEIQPFDGMLDTLAALKTAGKRLFVVSSKHSTPLRRNLAQIGMETTFEALCGSDMVAHYKPAPDGILNLLDRFELDPAQSVMIGDAIYDIQMGQNAHVATAGALWGAADPTAVKNQQPTYLLRHPKQLLII